MFIDQLWETVIGEHVELSAPRRTGKTHLLRRALSILGQFQIQTGHEHPHFKAVKRNYEPFLGSQGLSTTSSG
jgi:hypothetical protein